MPQSAQRIETRMVEIDEDHSTNVDWDAAWKSDDEDNGSDTPGLNRHSIEEERKNSMVDTPDDEAADAWGWGDDEDIAEENEPSSTEGKSTPSSHSPPSPPSPPSHPQGMMPHFREKTITEKYWTSSLPHPILKTVEQIYNDGATLLKPEYFRLLILPRTS